MARKFRFCLRCRRTISENEIERGLFVQAPNGLLCATCAQQLDEETEAAKQDAAVQAPVPVQVENESAPPLQAPPALAPVEDKPAPVSPPEPPKEPARAMSDPPAAAQPSLPEPPAQWLEGIREHLEAIHRTLVFEKTSPWNVLATIAQCLAVGMLILAAINWANDPTHLLLVALVFQVMALTFFVRGK